MERIANARLSQATPHRVNFDLVTNRMQPKNVWIGVHSLHGFDVHAGRFDHNPNCMQSKDALSHTAAFKNNHKKDFDFTLKYYCKNGNYKPDVGCVTQNMDVGNIEFKKTYGRSELKQKDYVSA